VSNAAACPVLLVDDDRTVLRSLAALLADGGRFHVVAAVTDAGEALDAAERHQPAIAVVDVWLPGGGACLVAGLRAISPDTVVVALTGQSDGATMLGLVRAGVTGFFSKGNLPDDFGGWLLRCRRGAVLLDAEGATEALGLLVRTVTPAAL
jgi:DNA-binding NarL/FixJ family response regulator